MGEEIIEKKVVKSVDKGSSNYLAKKYRGVKSAVGAACTAPILIIIAVVLLFYSEGFNKSSELVGQLSLRTPSEVAGQSGIVKVGDKVTVVSPVVAPEVGEVLYYSSAEQEYQQVEEKEYDTETVDREGREVEETVETTKLVDKWVDTRTTDPVWGEFTLGEIKIDPAAATLKMDYSRAEYWTDEFGDWVKLAQGETRTPELGDERLVVTYLDTEQNLIVVGELNNDKISGGSQYIITNKSDSDLMKTLKTEENFWYWFLKVIIWLLLVIGLTSIIGPLLALLDFIPLVGDAARNVAGLIAAVIAFLMVLIGSLLIKFWWLFLILLVLIVGGMIAVVLYILNKKKDDK
ncbi:MAG: TMEM43 family protein [Patescibacteria group bacterium]